MKKENERRIVAEKQVAENDNKIMQCKLNISVANDLIDLAQVEEKNAQKSRQPTQCLSKLQVGTEKTKIYKNYKRRKVLSGKEK